MPYKADGRIVYVKKRGVWKVHKHHKTAEKAKAHAAALNANVKE